jgi:hypothetical protein
MGTQEPEQDSKNSEIQDLIQTYKKVFQDLPMDLPPLLDFRVKCRMLVSFKIFLINKTN